MIIYKITNLVNNKVYIGQTTLTMEERFKTHWKDANRKDRPIRYFHRALKKYGIESFKIEQIDFAKTLEELNQKEIFWIKYYESNKEKFGYNLTTGGESGFRSKSTRNKIGYKKKQNWKDKELAGRMSEGLRRATEEWKRVCKEKRVTLICLYCKKEFKVIPSEADKRKFCSRSCSNKKPNKANLIKANKKNKEEYNKRKERLCKIAYDWVQKNKQYVLSIPTESHSISKLLNPLKEEILKEFDFKDWRTISKYICGDHRIKKLLSFLKTL